VTVGRVDWLYRGLDRERQSVHHLRVTARDSAVLRPLSSSVNLTVHVINVDDCLPTFERPLYRAFVSVDCPVGHEVRILCDHDVSSVIHAVKPSLEGFDPSITEVLVWHLRKTLLITYSISLVYILSACRLVKITGVTMRTSPLR